jgi:hypothetical protein
LASRKCQKDDATREVSDEAFPQRRLLPKNQFNGSRVQGFKGSGVQGFHSSKFNVELSNPVEP